MKQDEVLEGIDLAEQVRHLGHMLSELEALEARAAKPAGIINPTEVVYRDPRDAYDQLTIGAVLVRYGATANEARRLDGLLAAPLRLFLTDEKFKDLLGSAESQQASVGDFLLRMLNGEAGALENLGRHAEWSRARNRYVNEATAFLAGLDDKTRDSMMRRPVSRKQLSLIRYICEVLGTDFPALTDRWAAFEWLRDIGGNPRYCEVQP